MDEYVLDVLAKIIGIYSILILVIGTIGNLCAALVCTRKSLRKTPTFVFIGLALISDTICLYFWNVDHYLLGYNLTQIEDINLFFCKFATFFQTTSLQWSAWLLVMFIINFTIELRFKKFIN